MARIIKGNAGRVKQSTTKKYDPTNGETVSIEWAAPGANLSGYANELKNMRVPFEHTLTGVISRLVETASDEIATGSENVTVTERFDILYNEQQLDIKEHPNWIALDPEQSSQVLKDVNRFHDGKSGARTGNWDDTDVWGAAALVALDFYSILRAGVIHYPAESWVLRHTYNIPGDVEQGSSSLYPSAIDTGIGLVYTSDDLRNSIPATYARIREKINRITLPEKTGYIVGWRKRPTSETTVANNRIEVGAEYTYAQYPAILFSFA
jgi:hypothetical protein